MAPASDDEASAEGGALRSLFAADDSSVSTTASEAEDDDRPHPDGSSDACDPDGYETRPHLHILLRQRRERGAIAERLWPAARTLAAFVLARREALLEPWLDRGGGGGDDSGDDAIPILELGAGVGLTGLELAAQLPARVLLTDLADAMPLLRSNVQLNRERFRRGPDAVQVQPLEWGDPQQAAAALAWFRTVRGRGDAAPLLVIGSDCVYWPCLHEPLEATLSQILSRAPRGSLCVLAGMRRWKSDTRFFRTLGRRTATATHRLVAECIEETIERTATGRDITRIYKIQWLERNG